MWSSWATENSVFIQNHEYDLHYLVLDKGGHHITDKLLIGYFWNFKI